MNKIISIWMCNNLYTYLSSACTDILNFTKKQKKKRFLLPFLSLCFLLFHKDILYNTASFITIIFLCCMILFLNFPILVTWSNTKPLYYDDLYLDSEKLPSLKLPDYKKKSYKKLYKILLTVYDSIMIAMISNYWLMKTKDATSYYEIIGITGGILQIFHVLNLFTGTVILYAIKHMITNESKILPILNRLPSDDNFDLDNNFDELDNEIESDSEVKIKPINLNSTNDLKG